MPSCPAQIACRPVRGRMPQAAAGMPPRRLYSPRVGGRIGDGGSRTRIAPGCPGTGVVSARWASDCPSSPFSVKSVDIYTFFGRCSTVYVTAWWPRRCGEAWRASAYPGAAWAAGRRPRCPDRVGPLERRPLATAVQIPPPLPGNSGLNAVWSGPWQNALASAVQEWRNSGRFAPRAGFCARAECRGMPPRRLYSPRVGGRIGDGGSRTRMVPGWVRHRRGLSTLGFRLPIVAISCEKCGDLYLFSRYYTVYHIGLPAFRCRGRPAARRCPRRTDRAEWLGHRRLPASAAWGLVVTSGIPADRAARARAVWPDSPGLRSARGMAGLAVAGSRQGDACRGHAECPSQAL